MGRSKEEKSLLDKLLSGALDGIVGNDLTTSGRSTVWTVIKNGIPTRYKQGPGGKFFNGWIGYTKLDKSHSDMV